MTVSTEISREEYTGNGVTTDFDYRFRVFSADELVVSVADTTENISMLVLNTDYTVTGAGSRTGGKVKLVNPLANAWRISIERDLPVTQETDVRNQGNFFPEVHEDAWDKLTMLIQQAIGNLGLALRKPNWLARYYDAKGNRIVNLGNPINNQDAATKSYVDAAVDDSSDYADALFKRTLHVQNGETLTQLPPAAMRKGKLQAYDAATGDSLPIFPGTVEQETALDLQSADGLKFIGRCPTIAALRLIEPTKQMQLIDVAEYIAGGSVGGGYFVYDGTDLTSTDNSGSIIVTSGGARWKRRTDQLLPVHFGAVPGNLTDSTDAMQRYVASSDGKTVDFRGSYWTISATLDLTKVARIISDTSGIFKVDPVSFDGDYAITIGDPTLPYGSGRANRVVIDGSLYVDSLSRSSGLHGVYLKGQWLNIAHIRASGFNGRGIHREAIWDSTFLRLQTELCGNAANYAYYATGGGDTDNTNHVLSLQVEQSYDKAIYASGIRDVIHNIHCERTYITTTEAGDTTVAGLNYITCNFGLGNSILGQGVIDASPNTTAPDGTPTVTTVTSVVMAMDFSSVDIIAAPGSVISIGFGRSTEYTGLVAGDIIVAEPSAKITLNSPRVTRTLQAGSEVIINNPDVATFRPRANALGIQVNGGSIATLLFNNNYRGNITFNNVNIIGAVGDLRAPTGSGSGSSIGGLYAPTTFNNCTISTVNGGFGSRAIFYGGRISNVSLVSQSAFEFYSIDIGTFGYVDNIAFLTRGVKADVVNNWAEPRHYIWPAGTITERVGTHSSGGGLIYTSNSSSSVNWTAIVLAV